MDESEDRPSARLNELLNEVCDDSQVTATQLSYDWNKAPKLINHCSRELATTANNYLKGCKWSPDGSCLLTNSRDHCLRLFNLPQNLCQNPIILDEESEELVKDIFKDRSAV